MRADFRFGLAVSSILLVHGSANESRTASDLLLSLNSLHGKLLRIRSSIIASVNNHCADILKNSHELTSYEKLLDCAKIKKRALDEWVWVMIPTLYELRHYRRSILKMLKSHSNLDPYFVDKIRRFLASEDEIIYDAERVAKKSVKIFATPTTNQ